jgi:hypothetical protein
MPKNNIFLGLFLGISLLLASFFVLLSSSAAQSGSDCFKVYSKSLQQCSLEQNACGFNCIDESNDQDVYKSCSAGCKAARDACSSTAESAYNTCRSVSIEENNENENNEEINYEAGFVQSFLENPPVEEDLSVDEETQVLNEEIKSMFGVFDLSKIDTSIIVDGAEEVAPGVMFSQFRDPQTDVARNFYELTTNINSFITKVSGVDLGGNISFTTPDGVSFSPKSGDFIRIPEGTTIKTEVGFQASMNISGLSRGNSFVLDGAEIEITPSTNGRSNINVIQGSLRSGWSSFDIDSDIPPEIHFRGRPEVNVLSEGTDFGVFVNPETQDVIVEIYDGTIQVKSEGNKSSALSTLYGSDIKRLELYANGDIKQVLALAKSEFGSLQEAVSQDSAKNKMDEKDKISAVNPKAAAGIIVVVIIILGIIYFKRHAFISFTKKMKLGNKESKEEGKKENE